MAIADWHAVALIVYDLAEDVLTLSIHFGQP
jgi:hypothetical protein